MGRMMEYLALKTDPATATWIDSDVKQLKITTMKLITDATKLGRSGFGTSSLKWVASLSAMTNMLTSLLVPYIFFSFPESLFHFLRGEAGKWIALVAVVLRLFFPRHFPGWLEMPGSLILLLAVSPNFFFSKIER